MKILNLYAGIGGNRKLWGDAHDITAVEYDKDIAAIYKDLYPNDTVIVTDAHQYLLENYKSFDFIWSSPPCPSHSRMNFLLHEKGKEVEYPKMELYQEIILLQTFFKGKYAVENVRSYYNPLVIPQESGRHFFWCNFKIRNLDVAKKVRNDKGMTLNKKMNERGIKIKNFYGYKNDKRTLLNNCVDANLGLHILDCAMDVIRKEDTEQLTIF